MTVYVVFIGDRYYPSGGWDDHHSTHADLQSAMAVGDTVTRSEWADIVELTDGVASRKWVWSHGEAWTGRPQGWYQWEETL
jgi:hypothetical protein